MTERSAVVLGAAIGAALGGLAGFLLLTERGRQLRRDLEPRLADLGRELAALQGSVTRARSAADEGLRAVHEVSERRGAGGFAS